MPRTLHRTPVPSAYDDCEFSLTDLFCGGGGSSFGAEQVPGVRSVMAVIHCLTRVSDLAVTRLFERIFRTGGRLQTMPIV